MKTILFFATIFLVACLTFGSNNNRRKNDKQEDFEEMIDREKRDAMPKSGGMHFYFLVIYSKNTM